MPLLVNRKHVSQPNHSIVGTKQKGSLSRIVSDMNVSALQVDSAVMNSFIREMSNLLGQNNVNSSGARVSAH